MNKANCFRSSEFHMADGDILHILLKEEVGITADIRLVSGGDTANVDEVPDAPVALDASDITTSSFTANWHFMENTSGFYLDVATDDAFTFMVAGYDNLDVGYVNEYSVISLLGNYTYHYQLRGYNDIGVSEDSNTISPTTESAPANDWFLPSKDELKAMYDNLYVHGVGNFLDGLYWSSTESSSYANKAWLHIFFSGYPPTPVNLQVQAEKNILYGCRACRTFISDVVYALRDTGPAGGLIFYIVDNGDSTYTYYEAYTDDFINVGYSNVMTAIGVTAQGTAIGTGQANTLAIIGQVGHTESSAKECDDLIT